MKLRVLPAFLLIAIMGGSLLAIQEAQQEVYPEFYGFYVQSEGQLISLPMKRVSAVFPNELGERRQIVTGLFDLPQTDFKANRLTIIFFKPDAEKMNSVIKLTKLVFIKQLPLSLAKEQGGKSIEEVVTDIGMWLGETDVPLQIGPIEGKPGMLKLVTMAPLEPGVYAVHTGLINRLYIPGPNIPGGVGILGDVPSFSISIDRIDIDPIAKKPIGDLIVSDSAGYGRMEATNENINKLLIIAQEYLKTRTSVAGGEEVKNVSAWAKRAILPQLDCALRALAQALRLSDIASLAETSVLITDWVARLEGTKKIIIDDKALWPFKSFDRERNVRREIEKYVSPKKK